MAINFPTSPSVDDTYTYLDQTWICTSADPVIWERSTATETGNTEGNTGEVAYYDAKGSIIKGATAFYYDSTNLKVGIGTSGPDQTLGVSGDFYVSAGATFGGDVTIISAGDVALNLIADTDNSGENDNPIISMGQDGGEGVFELGVVGNAGQIFTNSTGNAGFLNTGSAWNDLQFSTNDSMRMTILRTGEVGIGTNAPDQTLGVSGDFYVSAGATFGSDVVFQGGISADAGATFANDIKVNDLTVGRGGGDVSTNTAVGHQALYANTTGRHNVASGSQALYNNTEGNYNVASGYRALFSNTGGDNNVASGYGALYSNTEGDYNVASGHKALWSNTGGGANVASGYNALYNNTEGNYNVASGYGALYSNTEGNANIASGSQALYNNTSGGANSAFGHNALYNNTSGQNNEAFGSYTLFSNTGGAYNVASGSHALYNNTEGDYNVASGHKALWSNTEGDYNVASGVKALYNNTEGDYNVASGHKALWSNTEGNYNVASGVKALYNNTEGDYNVASGYQALFSNTGGDANVAVGWAALYSNTGGNDNVASGYGALYSNTEGHRNVASGYRALFSNTGGDNNVASGYDAGRSILGSNNTVIGKDAGYDRYNDYTGSNNTYIGYNAQLSSVTASNEIVLGDSNVVVVRTAAGISAGGGITCDNLNVGGYWAGEQSDYVGIAIDNGTSVITTGKKAHRIIPWDCEVVEWTISSADIGIIQWDINWCTYENWPSTASVGGSNLPGITIGPANKAQDTSVDWAKTTFAAGDIIEFEVDSVTSLTNCILSIKIRRTG